MGFAVRAAIGGLLLTATSAQAWEPTKPIEIIVPFPPGGASDQMARTIQGAIQKGELVKQPIIIVNKPAAAGGEAMLDIQKSAGDPHKLITTSSGIYMTPLATKLPVSWKDFTPVAMMAQDAFALWVNAEKPYKTAQDFIEAAKAAKPPLKTGGNGSKREDHLISVTMEQATGTKITYVPYQGGGPASVQLAGGHIDANMNNPAEEIANWRSGAVKPLCVFSPKPMEYTQKVSQTPEWKAYLERNALVPDFRAGQSFVDFLTEDERKHKELMTKAGFIATN